MKKSGKVALACTGIAALAGLGVLLWKKEHARVHEKHEQELAEDLEVLGDEADEVLSDETEEEAGNNEKQKPVSMPTQILKTIWHSNLPVFGEEDDLMKVYSNYYYEPDKDEYPDEESYKKALEHWKARRDKLTMFDHSLHVLLVKDPNHSGSKYLRFMFRIRPYHRYGDPTLGTYYTFMKDFARGFWERNKLTIGAPYIGNDLWAGRIDPVYSKDEETGTSKLEYYEVSQFKLQTGDFSDYSDSKNVNDAMAKMASTFHGFKTSLDDLRKSGENRENWYDLGLYVCADFQVRRGGKKTDFDVLMAIKFLREFIENDQFEISKLVFHPGSDLGVFLDPEYNYDANTVIFE